MQHLAKIVLVHLWDNVGNSKVLIVRFHESTMKNRENPRLVSVVMRDDLKATRDMRVRVNGENAIGDVGGGE